MTDEQRQRVTQEVRELVVLFAHMAILINASPASVVVSVGLWAQIVSDTYKVPLTDLVSAMQDMAKELHLYGVRAQDPAVVAMMQDAIERAGKGQIEGEC